MEWPDKIVWYSAFDHVMSGRLKLFTIIIVLGRSWIRLGNIIISVKNNIYYIIYEKSKIIISAFIFSITDLKFK